MYENRIIVNLGWEKALHLKYNFHPLQVGENYRYLFRLLVE